MKPFFSVVIPLYNKGASIQNTLQSVFAQHFDNYEVIVVDDGSTDDSVEKANALDDSRIFIHQQENQGVSKARNVGVERSKGDYIAFLDADDLWHPNHLEALVDSINAFPNAILYCNNYQVRLAENFIRKAVFNLPDSGSPFVVDNYFEASTTDSLAWTSAVAVSKKDFEAIGGFNPRFKNTEDLDLWIRLALAGTVVFNPETTLTYHRNLAQLSQYEYNQMRYDMYAQYKEEEQRHGSLKKYLDVNRYALALRCKLNGERELMKLTRSEIDPAHLNTKQLLLLRMPRWLIVLLRKMQQALIRLGIYTTAYR